MWGFSDSLLLLYFIVKYSNLFKEPVTSVSPKLTSAEAITFLKVELNATIAIVAPVSGFPVPVYK